MICLRRKWLKIVKIIGGVLFLIQCFLFILFLNWPFGDLENRSYISFIALALSMAGYLTALIRGKIGGVLMITGALLFIIVGFINSNGEDIQTKLLLLSIIAFPVIVIGILFMFPVISEKAKQQKITGNKIF